MTKESYYSALTFVGDESGDISFSFPKGASRYFVVALVSTYDPDDLRQAVVDFRQRSHLPVDYEFSFHRLSGSRLLPKAFHFLAQQDFEAWALVVDKQILPDSFKVMRRLDFYVYFVTELIQHIPLKKNRPASAVSWRPTGRHRRRLFAGCQKPKSFLITLLV